MIGTFTINFNHETLCEAVQQYLRNHVGEVSLETPTKVVVVTALSRNAKNYADTYDVTCELKPFAEVFPIDVASMKAAAESAIEHG